MDKIRLVLPMVMANTMLDEDLPASPEEFSLYVAQALGFVANVSSAVHRRFLSTRDTQQRLEEILEMMARLQCPGLEKGVLLTSL